jgi:hypothetical protein
MIERVHEHAVSELQQNARTDTVFVITAVAFNFVVLAISWSVASWPYNRQRNPRSDWILGLLIIITLVINALAIRALMVGRATRVKLLSGLVQLYRDQGVDKYYDPELLESYSARYRLFAAVVGVVGLTAILVPLLERLFG